MEQILHILNEILLLVNEMSPYLILGFLLAGLMHTFIPGSLYSRYLADGSFRSVLLAALFGIPLPLCSCGVIPTAMSLRREGASKGAAVSFLIATPQTGVDSIIATYSLMGLPFAIVRPIAALFTAIFGGALVNFANRSETNAQPQSSASATAAKQSFGSRIVGALRYAFVEMMEDIGKWLIVGLIVAGLITVLVPDSFFEVFKGNTMLSMLLVLCIAIPMYVCATGSIPIAVALMMKGLTPGAALVLLMAGPACNLASILVINKVLGRRTLVTYLLSIITGSILFGIGIDTLLPAEWFTPNMLIHSACCHEEPLPWFNTACTILLGILLLHALWHHYRHGDSCHCGGDSCHCHEDEGKCHCHEHEETAAATHTFTIKGMNCNHCRNSVIKALEALPGTESVSVDLASGHATLTGPATDEEIRTAVESIGFKITEP